MVRHHCLATLALACTYLFTMALASISSSSQQRRKLSPDESIGEHMKQLRGDGEGKGKGGGRGKKSKQGFTVTTEIAPGSEGQGTELALDVVEAEPAVTPDTILSRDGRTGSPIGDAMLALLVADTSTVDGSDTFAILAVDDETDEVHGLVEMKNAKAYKIKQGKAQKATATEEIVMSAPHWECGVANDNFVEEDGKDSRRRLGLLDNHGDHHYDHHNIDGHDHHAHQEEDLSHVAVAAMESLRNSLRGTNINPIGTPHRNLQNSGNYNYQVDLYIEIDSSFITKTGNGDITVAANYINTMVTAANVVYEEEIDTHFHVSYIVESSLYDGATSTSTALTIMRNTYASSAWHHAGVDVHHALLGNNLGGGIAYVGVLCNPSFGYGLTASISGSFQSLDYSVVLYLKGFMHELG